MKRILEEVVKVSVGEARGAAAIEADVTRGILQDFRRFPLDVHALDRMLAAAWTIAEELKK